MCFPATGRFSAQRQTHGGPLRVFWDGDKKPVTETARAWVKFLQNRKHSRLGACPLSSQSIESRRIPGADRQGGSLATHRSGAGSRMKRNDFDSQRITAPMAGESGLLHRICSHVNFRVIVGAMRLGSCLVNVCNPGCQTSNANQRRVVSFLRHNPEKDVRERHKDIIEGIAIMLDTYSHIQDLAAWDYTDEQMATVKSRFKFSAWQVGGVGCRAAQFGIRPTQFPWNDWAIIVIFSNWAKDRVSGCSSDNQFSQRGIQQR